MMRAMQLSKTGPLHDRSLERVEVPVPAPGDIRLRVLVCGVCHTELDKIEGRTPPPHLPVTPGHQVIGRLDAIGDGLEGLSIGDRVGVAWKFHAGGLSMKSIPYLMCAGRECLINNNAAFEFDFSQGPAY
jgi:propanol-preferring alcohol dehydrogenase